MAKHFTVKARLEGGSELIAEMKKLGINVRASNRKAARAGAQIIQKDAEARAATLSRRGGKSTRIKTSSRSGSSVEARVEPSKRKWYLRFAELGTVSGTRTTSTAFRFYWHGRRIVTKRIHHPGTKARPWLQPAFDARQNEARDAYGAVMVKCLDEKRAQLAGADEA